MKADPFGAAFFISFLRCPVLFPAELPKAQVYFCIFLDMQPVFLRLLQSRSLNTFFRLLRTPGRIAGCKIPALFSAGRVALAEGR